MAAAIQSWPIFHDIGNETLSLRGYAKSYRRRCRDFLQLMDGTERQNFSAHTIRDILGAFLGFSRLVEEDNITRAISHFNRLLPHLQGAIEALNASSTEAIPIADEIAVEQPVEEADVMQATEELVGPQIADDNNVLESAVETTGDGISAEAIEVATEQPEPLTGDTNIPKEPMEEATGEQTAPLIDVSSLAEEPLEEVTEEQTDPITEDTSLPGELLEEVTKQAGPIAEDISSFERPIEEVTEEQIEPLIEDANLPEKPMEEIIEQTGLPIRDTSISKEPMEVSLLAQPDKELPLPPLDDLAATTADEEEVRITPFFTINPIGEDAILFVKEESSSERFLETLSTSLQTKSIVSIICRPAGHVEIEFDSYTSLVDAWARENRLWASLMKQDPWLIRKRSIRINIPEYAVILHGVGRSTFDHLEQHEAVAHLLNENLSLIGPECIIDIRPLAPGRRSEKKSIVVVFTRPENAEIALRRGLIWAGERKKVVPFEDFRKACNNCYSFTHRLKFCDKATVCQRCAGLHFVKECPRTSKARCVYCKKPKEDCSGRDCPTKIEAENTYSYRLANPSKRYLSPKQFKQLTQRSYRAKSWKVHADEEGSSSRTLTPRQTWLSPERDPWDDDPEDVIDQTLPSEPAVSRRPDSPLADYTHDHDQAAVTPLAEQDQWESLEMMQGLEAEKRKVTDKLAALHNEYTRLNKELDDIRATGMGMDQVASASQKTKVPQTVKVQRSKEHPKNEAVKQLLTSSKGKEGALNSRENRPDTSRKPSRTKSTAMRVDEDVISFD